MALSQDGAKYSATLTTISATSTKQLISTHNQVYRGGDRRRKDFVEDMSSPPSPTSEAKKVTSAVVYFDNSSIPKYDLEEVENLHLPQELKNLIASRQAAKLRQESDEEKHLTFGAVKSSW